MFHFYFKSARGAYYRKYCPSLAHLLDLLVGGFEVGVGGGEIFCGGVEVVLNLLDLLVQGVDLIVTLKDNNNKKRNGQMTNDCRKMFRLLLSNEYQCITCLITGNRSMCFPLFKL